MERCPSNFKWSIFREHGVQSHDYLITSFETGDVPDVFHYESSVIIDYAMRLSYGRCAVHSAGNEK